MCESRRRLRRSRRTDYAGPMTEVFFTSLLALVTVFIVWFSLYVIYRLFKSE